MPTQDQADALADAVWQVLDDMGADGTACCLAAKAQLRIAYEPFVSAECPPDMALDAAVEIAKSAGIL